MVQKTKESTGNKWRQWVMGLLANITLLTYGMQSGWMSPTIQTLKGPNSPSGYVLSDTEISMIASAITVSAVFSCTGFSVIADRYGRKFALIGVAVSQALGWIIKLTSANPIILILSQVLCGIAGSGVFSVAPVYTKEISEDSIRGAMGSVGMSMQSIGMFVMYAMGAYLDYFFILWVAVWIPILNALFLIVFAPESPSYLAKKGRVVEAQKTLASLMGRVSDDKSVVAAVSTLCNEQAKTEKLPKVTIKRLFSDRVTRKSIYLGFFMISVLDVGGNFAIFAYASVILQQSGANLEPNVQALALPVVMIIGSLVSTVTVEKCGRKILLITCLILNGLPMLILGTVLLLQQYQHEISALVPILSIVTSVFAYGAGVLPVPYIVMSEIFSYQIRAKILGCYVTYGWFLCFVQTISFTPISNFLGMYTMFYIFGALNFISAILCLFFMPETKGKSVEQIQKELEE